MHVLHFLAVEAEDRDDAVGAAEMFLDGYEGRVWDWYSIGDEGRWVGVLGAAAHDGVLRYADDPDGFRAAIEGALQTCHREFRRLRDELIGNAVDAAECGTLWGLPVPDPVGAAQRISAANRTSAARFAAMLAADAPDASFGMLAWMLERFAQLAGGSYTSDSMFADVVVGSTFADAVWPRTVENPAHQWLVAVDLHF